MFVFWFFLFINWNIGLLHDQQYDTHHRLLIFKNTNCNSTDLLKYKYYAGLFVVWYEVEK